jgi:diguanylate cyclase (GGDEF)-like protein/putative nucleotidyltransferase with HDIG domain
MPSKHKTRPSVTNATRTLVTLRLAFAVAVILSCGALLSVSIYHSTVPAWSPVVVLAAVGAFIQVTLWGIQRWVNREYERLERGWIARQTELEEVANKDDLTQLQNRRVFYQRLQAEMKTAADRHGTLSVLMIDVDDLKAINDEFGHQLGDKVLRSFARILNHYAGAQNITARLGGDEFAVILPGAGRREAEAVATRIWEELSHTPILETEHASIYLGVSIGAGGYPWGGHDLEEVIHWADTKLYANKLQRKGFKQNRNGNNNDQRLVSAVVDVLSTALDVRDQMTHRHARRVSQIASAVAREMGLTEDQVQEVEYAAALHDIGKIGVADSILRKSSPLDDAEWREMRRHSELGFQILNGIDFLHEAAEIVYSHHERWDGSGYPRGLKGEEIPLGARIFAVVDAFDAMTSRRPYREAMSREEALMEVVRNSGSQFDPNVIGAFMAVIRRSPETVEEGDDFGPRITSAAPASARTRRRRQKSAVQS